MAECSGDPLPPELRKERNRYMAQALVRSLRPGEDRRAEAKRYRLSPKLAAGCARSLVRKTARKQEKNRFVQVVRGLISAGSDPLTWPTPEALSQQTGIPADDIRRALNVLAGPRVSSKPWGEWRAARDADRVRMGRPPPQDGGRP